MKNILRLKNHRFKKKKMLLKVDRVSLISFLSREFPLFFDIPKDGLSMLVNVRIRRNSNLKTESYIEPKFLASQGIFNEDYICNLVKRHISGIEDQSMRVWCFYTFQKWYLNSYLMLNS